jgi:hypothetical protein
MPEDASPVSVVDLTRRLPTPVGQAGAVETMGTIAAPLLGGFAFAAIALVLQIRRDLGWPDGALVLLVLVFLLFVTSVQATFHAKRHYVAPDEWLAWLELASSQTRRQELQRAYIRGLESYRWWSSIARRTYSLAIVGLFSATAVLLVPSGHIGLGRAIAIALAGLGAIGECVWALHGELEPRRKRRTASYRRPPSAGDIRTPRVAPPDR